jgi:hypothetical protein
MHYLHTAYTVDALLWSQSRPLCSALDKCFISEGTHLISMKLFTGGGYNISCNVNYIGLHLSIRIYSSDVALNLQPLNSNAIINI